MREMHLGDLLHVANLDPRWFAAVAAHGVTNEVWTKAWSFFWMNYVHSIDAAGVDRP